MGVIYPIRLKPEPLRRVVSFEGVPWDRQNF
jgi:hypothetical protein